MKYSLRMLIGISLWWAEGTKSKKDVRWKTAVSYPVEVTNTDPKIIQAFLFFLRKDIGIEENRLKIQIQIHQDNNEKECERYWSNITNVPINRFNKTIIRPIGHKPGKTKGTCKIRYVDKNAYLELTKILQHVQHVLAVNTGISAVG